jgi:hypothetical protein
MDARNTFETRTTARLARLEAGALLGVCLVLSGLHLGDIRWVVFAGLFAVIDVVGYLPGAYAYRRSVTGAVARRYYVVYNTMHSLVTWTVVIGGWVVVSGWEWALLAVPIHLLGDRALFGNSMKPFGVAFEPEPHPAFAAFEAGYARLPAPWPGSPSVVETPTRQVVAGDAAR